MTIRNDREMSDRLKASNLLLKLQKREPKLGRELTIHVKSIIRDLESQIRELTEVGEEMATRLEELESRGYPGRGDIRG